jgi:hypothetical protein
MSYLDRDHRPTGVDIGHQILASEGIEIHRFPPGMQKSKGLVDASIDMFGIILPDEDPRWHIAHGFQKQVLENGHTGFNYESALRAIYLGEPGAKRSGYPTTMTEENLRQMVRALQNLSAHGELHSRMEALGMITPEGIDLKLVLTDRLSRGANPDGTTGCPEALYQLRAFDEKGYLARIGFNVHTPVIDGATTPTLSITNVQGTPNSGERLKAFRERAGAPVFNYLVRKAKAIAAAPGFDPMLVYGIKNPENPFGINKDLYHSAFTREGVRELDHIRPAPNSPQTRQSELAVLFQHRRPMPNGHQERGN